MRILLVTHRYGEGVHGGGERFLRELVTRLASRGHEVVVLTTRSLCMISSPLGYFLWDNLLPPGPERDRGVEVRRFPVKNPRPGRGARRSARLLEYLEKERQEERFVHLLGENLAGTEEHCFLSGWHRLEEWEDGPARWTRKRAKLIAGGKGMEGFGVELHSPWGGKLGIVLDKGERRQFTLAPGRREEFRLSFSRRNLLEVMLECERTIQPPGDGRELGVALRRIYLLDGGRRRELALGRDWEDFMRTAPEELLGRLLWAVVENRPRRLAKWRDYLIGPRSPRLEREARRAARRCDLVMGAMVPVTTMVMAWKAARKAGKPFVAVPLFHPRDYNHYWADFYRAMREATGVEANSPVIQEIMEDWGFPAFCVGPGFDLEEYSSKQVDGNHFRLEYGLEGRKVLLWVGRKNASKGYPTAVAAVHRLRERGLDALLLMVGPDDDGEPLPSEGVVYTGPLPREKLLDAYAACDLFIFPSLNESYCLVLNEARLLGKPVLGNVYCAAARGQIEHGVDGYLCADAEDYVRYAWELLNNGVKASEMGERGREKVRRERNWNTLVETYERLLESYAGGDSRARNG
ncbi:glycosyltransferase [Candidatus Solincola sp.]|jgi:glycosyltransferase involved in cell wall biosynthesis|nr:glycosyltransferase [Actinomycetota bacterium]MDI7251721.1 glycosyltransferase [Actinomycetota bacterium]